MPRAPSWSPRFSPALMQPSLPAMGTSSLVPVDQQAPFSMHAEPLESGTVTSKLQRAASGPLAISQLRPSILESAASSSTSTRHDQQPSRATIEAFTSMVESSRSSPEQQWPQAFTRNHFLDRAITSAEPFSSSYQAPVHQQ